MILQYITSSGKWRTFFKNNLSFPASLIDESDTIWCQKPVGVKNAKMILETPQKVKKNHKTIQNNDFVTLFVVKSRKF